MPHLYLPRLAGRLGDVPRAGERVPLVFAGNHCKGSIFENGIDEATPALAGRLDAIARDVPEFHFGRVDVRYESLAALRRGEGFTIIEINGAGSEPTHIWDPRTRLMEAWRTQFEHYGAAFRIGAANRARGLKGCGLRETHRMWRLQRRVLASYPRQRLTTASSRLSASSQRTRGRSCRRERGRRGRSRVAVDRVRPPRRRGLPGSGAWRALDCQSRSFTPLTGLAHEGNRMTAIQAILIAVLQGATELFPVSSLGHAVVLPALLGWGLDQRSPDFLPFLVMLHLGTAAALLLYFWRDWLALATGLVGLGQHVGESRRVVLLVVIATIPAVVAGFLAEKLVRGLFGSPVIAAAFLVVNAGLLLFGERLRGRLAGTGAARELSSLTHDAMRLAIGALAVRAR